MSVSATKRPPYGPKYPGEEVVDIAGEVARFGRHGKRRVPASWCRRRGRPQGAMDPFPLVSAPE